MQEIFTSVQKVMEPVLQTWQGYEVLQHYLNDFWDGYNKMHQEICEFVRYKQICKQL